MSVNLIPVFIDRDALNDEIEWLRSTLPPDQLDLAGTYFHERLEPEHGPRSPHLSRYPQFNPHNSTRRALDAKEMRLQLLVGAQRTIGSDPTRAADALYQFFGLFLCCFSDTNPFNEYGFQNSTIMSPASARRFHLLFQTIDFKLLRPLFNEHCQQDEYGNKYNYIEKFEELVEYAKALDDLLVRALELNRVLYIFVSF